MARPLAENAMLDGEIGISGIAKDLMAKVLQLMCLVVNTACFDEA